jgi:DNA excision repair protein ERCC-2
LSNKIFEHIRRFCSQRLTSLIHTLELSDLDEYYALHKVAAFATLVATYATGNSVFKENFHYFGNDVLNMLTIVTIIGFLLILEPFENETVPNPILHYALVKIFSFITNSNNLVTKLFLFN